MSRKGHPLVCHHAWVIAQEGGEYAEVCVECGAGCTRDLQTKRIVAFDAKLPDQDGRPRNRPDRRVSRPAEIRVTDYNGRRQWEPANKKAP